MKKAIFFQVYLGTANDDQATLDTRFIYFENQLSYLQGLLKVNEYSFERYLIITAPSNFDSKIEKTARIFEFNIYQNTINRENLYEYPGFKKMQEYLNNQTDEMAILYCHTKGIFNQKNKAMGIFKFHLQTLLSADIDEVFTILDYDKACLFPSISGWCWQNFFWIRGSYLKKLTVRKSEKRHYYERLIGQSPKGKTRECFNLSTIIPELEHINSNKYFSAQDINKDHTIQQIFLAYSSKIKALKSRRNLIRRILEKIS